MSNEKNAERLEKLHAMMSVYSWPDIAEAAGVPMLDAELYATGRRVIPDTVWESLNSAIINADYARALRPKDLENASLPESEVYRSRSPKNVGIAVRFSEKEWERVVKMFPPDTDIEKCIRAFILNGLKDDILRDLYVPQRYKEVCGGFDIGGEEGLNERFLFERDGCRVVVELEEGALDDLIKDGEEDILKNPRHYFAEHVFMSEYDRRACGDVFETEWKERAIEAEAKLDGISRILRSNLAE